MKKIILIPIMLLLLSCTKSADYTKMKITTSVNGQKVFDETIEGSFTKTKVDESLGLVEITEPDNRIKVSYYEESNPNELKFLNIKIGESNLSEWRRNKGHHLIIVPKKDSLGFSFRDKNSATGDVIGTILYTK